MKSALWRPTGRPMTVSYAWSECESGIGVVVVVMHSPQGSVTANAGFGRRLVAGDWVTHAPQAYVTASRGLCPVRHARDA